jgi:hypothetical protein
MTAAQRSPHIPDVTNPIGFWAIVNVGNIIELAVALDPRTYDGTIKEDKEEQEPAMSKYRFFIRWFNHHFVALVDGYWVNATFVFWRALVDFACVVIHYRATQYDEDDTDPDANVVKTQALYTHIRQHFVHNWYQLLPYFDQKVKQPGSRLTWQDEGVVVMPRSPHVIQDLRARGLTQTTAPPHLRIFDKPHADQDTTWSPPPQHGNKRRRADPTPPPTPSSSQRHAKKRTRKSRAMVVDSS